MMAGNKPWRAPAFPSCVNIVMLASIMMNDEATFENGGMSVEAGVAEMHDGMRGGRWKVFRDQNDGWLEEYRLYFRKDGLLIKENDDAISASRYALMMRRFGQTDRMRASFLREIQYPNLGII